MEFWNSEITNKSWEMLIDFSRKYDFILIGGWAIYLYSQLQKSRDIDIIVSYESFSVISNDYPVKKNMSLKKYEIKFKDFDVDIYLPHFSILSVPPSDILDLYSTVVANIKVPTIETLLTLKLGAYSDRLNSIKGDKDSLDIVGLLSKADINMEELKSIFRKYNLYHFSDHLKNAILRFDHRLLPYLNLNENSFSKLKKRLLEQIDNTNFMTE